MMDEIDKLMGTNDVNMNAPKEAARIPEHCRGKIESKEFEPGGRYYFPNNGEDSDARDENCCASVGRCCCPRISIK